MSTQQIRINPNPQPSPTQPGSFSPQTVIASAGDNLTWVNNDSGDHWPAPSAANPKGWFPYRIPGGSESGDLALGPNSVYVTAATNAAQAVFTTQGAAPDTGVTVKLTYSPPNPPPNPASPWQAATNGKSFAATNLGPNSCSIPLDSTALGALVGLITITKPGAYTLNYVCALHPAETGSITVNPQQ
jgi:plastocyanin